jgi:RHS repeat-associated protein
MISAICKKIFYMALKKTLTFLLIAGLIGPVMAQNNTHPTVRTPGGIQVNSYSGNMDLTRSDLTLAGRMPIRISFTYKSADYRTDRGYGKGWTFNYGMKLIEQNDSIYILRNNGSKDLFTPGSGTLMKSQPGNFDSLKKISATAYQLRTRDGSSYFFENSSHKRVTRQIDRNGNALIFSYTDSLISTITDNAGRIVRLTYQNQRLYRVIEENGSPARTWTYEYDNAGNLLKVTDPMGYRSEYKYAVYGPMNVVKDRNGNAVDIIYNRNLAVKEVISCLTKHSFIYSPATNTTHVTELVGATNQLTNFIFDAKGNIVRKTGNCCGYNVTMEYDEHKNTTKTTNANGNSTTYTYDGRGNMLSMTDADGNTSLYTYESVFGQLTSFKDRNGSLTTYVHDERGNLLRAVYPLGVVNEFTYNSKGDMLSSKDGNGNVTRFMYNDYGNVLQSIKPLGAVHKYSYDEKGRVTGITDPRNNSAIITYDKLDHVTGITDAAGKQTLFTYDNNGNRTSTVNRIGKESRFELDALDRVIKVINPENQSTLLSYDARGNLLKITDPNGDSKIYTYDNLNRLASFTNGLQESVVYGYDNAGNVTSVYFPNGNLLSLTYDKLNRLKKMSDKRGMLSSYAHDKLGNITSITDANGNSRSTTYDLLSRPATRTDGMGKMESYTYDKRFNLVAIKNRKGNSWTITYDSLNRATSQTDPLGHILKFRYDAADNLTEIEDAKNNITSYTYNIFNRHTKVTYADGSTNLLAYDDESRVTGFTDGNGALTTYSYDGAGRLIKKDFPGNNDAVYTYDPAGRLIAAANKDALAEFFYNAAGRVVKEKLNGVETLFDYNPGNRKMSIIYPGNDAIAYTYDERNQLTNITKNGVPVSTFQYDNGGRLTSQVFPQTGMNTAYGYDANNRMTSMVSNPQAPISSSFVYDEMDNLLLENKANRPGLSKEYQYDAAMRLTGFKSGTINGSSITAPTRQEQFNYDAAGNRLTAVKNGQSVTYTSNTANQYTGINNGSLKTLTYDRNGNMINDGTHSFSYNTENRLVAVNGGTVASYRYDALNRRISKSEGVDSVFFYYAGLNEIERRGSGGVAKGVFVFGSGIDKMVASSKNGKDHFYFTDQLGSVMAVGEAGNNIVERYEYDAFGGVQIQDGAYTQLATSAIGNDLFFTGRSYEKDIDRYYFRARHYDAAKGRFEQRDPLSYLAGDMNLYSYVKNMPTRYVDPMGTECHTPGWNSSDVNIDDGLYVFSELNGFLNLEDGYSGRAKGLMRDREFAQQFKNDPRVKNILNLTDNAIGRAKELAAKAKALNTAIDVVSGVFSIADFASDPTLGHGFDLLLDATEYFAGLAGATASIGLAGAVITGFAIGNAGVFLANQYYGTDYTLGELLFFDECR